MPVLPEDLLDELRQRLADLEIEEVRLLPALVDSYRYAADEAQASWDTDTPVMPDIVRSIIVRGARRILVNPDQHRQEQSGDYLTQLAVSEIFGRDDLRRLRSLAPKSRLGSIRFSRPGLAETAYGDRFVDSGRSIDHLFSPGYDGSGAGTAAAQWANGG